MVVRIGSPAIWANKVKKCISSRGVESEVVRVTTHSQPFVNVRLGRFIGGVKSSCHPDNVWDQAHQASIGLPSTSFLAVQIILEMGLP